MQSFLQTNVDCVDGTTQENSLEEEPPLNSPTPLRPLTSLKWPYVPDESAFPDPLKKNDPKTLQLSQYEAIGTSSFLLFFFFFFLVLYGPVIFFLKKKNNL